MSEKKIERVVNAFREAFDERNVEKMLALFAQNAVWVSPVGTFKGKEGLRRVLTWDTQVSPTVKNKRCGIGIMVKGNKAVAESISEGWYEGKRYKIRGIVAFEFAGDRIQHIRLFYDKLSVIKQVAMQYKGITGWFTKKLVNAIVKRGEKGLR